MFMIIGLFLSTPQAWAAGSLPATDISGPVNFTLNDLDSKAVSIAAYRGKKPVLLIFWTSWCPYCLIGLRDLNQKYPGLQRSGFDVLAINAGESRDKAARVAKDYELKFKVLLDIDQETVGYFRVVGIPLYVLLNKQGEVVFRDNRYPADEIAKRSAR
ncbi:MAG: TlpA disulfide reductase family protein [Candidatus Omnitrophota bacterium]